jgi:peptidoglycan/xylan/chitin deacetylase (PgdA/CDA1 family)
LTPTLQVLLGSSALCSLAAGAAYYSTYAVRTQWLGPTVWRGRQDLPAVALTFDDGPASETERILDVLDRSGATATFFMVGRQVERSPHIARRVVASGHTVGNHSYSHPIYLYRSARETYRELARTQEILTDVTGVQPSWSRPPCGVRSRAYFAAARTLGLQTVQWTVAGFDWQRRSPGWIAKYVVDRATAGSIVLLHDGDSSGKEDRQRTVAAVPLIIDGLAGRGLRVSPLASLMPQDLRPLKGAFA